MKGRFIVFEGIDGSGKTSVARYVYRIVAEKMDAVLTREPTSGEIGRMLIASIRGDLKLTPYQRALLFAADRHGHVEEVIKPGLRAGRWIICDRYKYSSFAYQMAEGIDLDLIRTINKFAPEGHLVFYLDVDPVEGPKRLSDHDHFERSAFLRRVKFCYDQSLPRWTIRLDANRSLDDVLSDVMVYINEELKYPDSIDMMPPLKED